MERERQGTSKKLKGSLKQLTGATFVFHEI